MVKNLLDYYLVSIYLQINNTNRAFILITKKKITIKIYFFFHFQFKKNKIKLFNLCVYVISKVLIQLLQYIVLMNKYGNHLLAPMSINEIRNIDWLL